MESSDSSDRSVTIRKALRSRPLTCENNSIVTAVTVFPEKYSYTRGCTRATWGFSRVGHFRALLSLSLVILIEAEMARKMNPHAMTP
jgi:hypothetical protein